MGNDVRKAQGAIYVAQFAQRLPIYGRHYVLAKRKKMFAKTSNSHPK